MNKLNILWTNADPLTSEKMVFMYGINSLIHKWWDEVDIIIWGATAKLAAESDLIQLKIQHALEVGATIYACKACADQLGVTDNLTAQGIKVEYFGQPLTEILQSDAKLLSI